MTTNANKAMKTSSWRPQTWYEGVEQCQQTNEAYVLVTVVGTAGSTSSYICLKSFVVCIAAAAIRWHLLPLLSCCLQHLLY